MDLQLKGKTALVMAASKGLGKACATALAMEGVDIVIGARDRDTLEKTADEIRALGRGRVLAVSTDVNKPEEAERIVAAAVSEFGRIDILVNVAGGSGPIGKSGVETTPQEFDDIVTLNMNGCFHTMRGVLPTMMAQRYGKIVNVGGTFGMRGRAGRMAYSASKWGLRGITKSFALEVGAYNINVNCVAPGMVDGPRFRDKVCADMATRLGIAVDEAVEAMRELMLASQPAAIFPMEVRTTAADDAYLSSNYRTATTVISVSGQPGHDYWDYLFAVDQLLGQFGARVHWGKLHYLTRAQLAERYPESERFIAIRRELDPVGIFLNEHLRPLFA